MASKSATAAELLRERKVNGFLEQISQIESQIQELKGKRDALSETDILGLSVNHKLFGEGKVSQQDRLTITVQFGVAAKRFAVPAAFFEGFLSTEDTGMHERLEQYQQQEAQILEAKGQAAAAERAVKLLKK